MSDLSKHILEMIQAPGLSGFEEPIHAIIREAWNPYVDELSTSKLGSLYGLKKGEGKTPRKKLLIATHMDAIGLIITEIRNGLLRFTEIGGIDARVLPGQEVIVHGTEELEGYIIQPPNHTLPEYYRDGVVPMGQLFIDVGLKENQVKSKIKIGDLVSFATKPVELSGNTLYGQYLDNRSSVAVVTETLRLLQKRKHSWDVWATATVQEEETVGGAITAGYEIRPHLAIVIDVTFGNGPGTSSSNSYKLDSGPTLDWGPNTHPKFYKEFEKLFKELEIKHQTAVYSRSSGTDAMLLQIAAEGIPTMIFGLPLRYMHTPVELIQVRDIERLARALGEFICQLEDNFLEKIAWQDEDDKGK